MNWLRFVVVLLGLGNVALALELPATFDVKDVAAGDVLNVRETPAADASIVGKIGPFDQNVEILELSTDGKWGKVGIPEGNGWVAMRYLDLNAPSDPQMIPRPISCYGTEPFWSLSLRPGVAEYNSPETGAVGLAITTERVGDNGYLLQMEEGPTLIRTMIVARQSCYDGMSDRQFGFSALMFVDSPEGNDLHRACCTLDGR